MTCHNTREQVVVDSSKDKNLDICIIGGVRLAYSIRDLADG